MKKISKIILTIVLFSFFYTLTNAQDNIILFHSNNCAYCKDLIAGIEEKNLNEILDIQMLEASEEGFQEIFYKSLDECEINREKAGYPTLYHDGECSVGSLNAMNTLLELAGIENTEVVDEENEQITEAEEIRTLSDITLEEEEIEPRPIWEFIAMLVGPLALIGLTYFIIKKLNL